MIRFDRASVRDPERRGMLLDLLEVGLAAVDPERVVLDALDDDLPRGGVWVLAIGKAAVPMARGAAVGLGARLAGGIALTRAGYGGRPPDLIERFEAGHPLPDRAGLRAARAIRGLCARLDREDRLLCLLSGGGSALLAAPPAGVRLEDLAATTGLLLASGAAIDEINTVRRHLSTLQGGGLAAAAHPACLTTWILSDVVGDRPEAIASGPTVPDPTTFDDAAAVLQRYRLWEEIPSAVRTYLENGLAGRVPETAKPGDPVFAGSQTRILASNATYLDAVCLEATRIGLRAVRATEPMTGEAREVGTDLGTRLARLAGSVDGPTLGVSGGESTVTLRGGGQGGRNQELALAAAKPLAGIASVQLAAHATDGTDGPTEAAGAIVDGETIERGLSLGFDAEASLRGNDSHPFLAATNDLLWTGPTGTNVADVVLGLLRP